MKLQAVAHKRLRRMKKSQHALLLRFVLQHRALVAATAFLGFLVILLGILIPVFLGKFYQLALQTHSARGQIFDQLFGHISTLPSYFTLLGGLLLFRGMMDYLQGYFAGICGERFSRYLREQLFARQMRASISQFAGKEVGGYLLRYSGDMTSALNYFVKGIIGFANDMLFICLALLVLASLDLQLAVVLFVGFPTAFGIIYFLNKRLKKMVGKRRNTRSGNLAFVTMRLSALLSIKVFNREPVEIEKYEKRSEKLYDLGVRYTRLNALINALLPFFLYLLLAIVLWVSVYLEPAKAVDGAVILIFVMLLISTIPALKRVLKVNQIWQAGDISLRKIAAILDMPLEYESKEGEGKLRQLDIALREVSFSYAEGQVVLDHFSCAIPDRKLTKITGDQGKGKSTILKLLTGLYHADSGAITIGGRPIAEIGIHALRKLVAAVAPDLPLLGSTVFEVVSYSRKPEKRPEALETLLALGFITTLDDAVLDTPIQEGGRNLSAGQRKVLAIARALLTRKKILLLDEPFTDLDETFKEKFIAVLHSLKRSKTIVVIDGSNDPRLLIDHTIHLK